VIRGWVGCGLLMTSFTSSEGINASAKKTLRYLSLQRMRSDYGAAFWRDSAVMRKRRRWSKDLGRRRGY